MDFPSLFLKITTIISKFIPVAVLASVALIVIDLGGDSILSVAAGAGTQVLTILLMIAIVPLVDMFDTMNNTTGDLAAALIFAKSENLFDRTVFDGP